MESETDLTQPSQESGTAKRVCLPSVSSVSQALHGLCTFFFSSSSFHFFVSKTGRKKLSREGERVDDVNSKGIPGSCA